MDRYTKGFVIASLVYFFLASVLGIWMGSAEPAGWVRFTHVHFNLLGFMSMMIYGVGYFILPRFNGRALRYPSWVKAHFYISNIGLIGMVAAYPSMPSAAFVLFAVLSVAGVALFVANLGATMLLAPAETGEAEEVEDAPPAAAGETAPEPQPRVDIDPDMRVGEILTRWPDTVGVFVANGFASLGNPEHREQVKQIPITLRMACQRHNVDLEPMVAMLISAAGGEAPKAAAAGPGTSARPRKGGLRRGDPIGTENILGEILDVYPETTNVFRKYYGEGCFSCPGQATESVKQSAMMHNVSEKQLLSELNRAAGF
ncbi:MAG: DUF1858 domain-containing protein [Deltaproteobacteria bacterium]|nr:DUF1858 domain-containing protein [Deltaproteobacteria bacterium]